MQLLPEPILKDLDNRLKAVLAQRLACAGLDEFSQRVAGYVLNGGKRVRPQLCLWTWSHLTRRDAPPALLDLACGWELFHAFLLAHDDIIDSADTRRDAPSLHVTLATLDSDSPAFGRNLGIVSGDLLYTAASGLWIDADFEPVIYRRQLQLLNRVASMTGFGQAIDICLGHAPLSAVVDEQLLLEYYWKTAAYTFEGPMLTAAIAADVPAPQEAAIARFAMALGQAYQLQNDLDDLAAPVHEGCDLVQGKRTITLLRYRATLSPAQQQTLDDIHADGPLPLEYATSLRQRLLASDAVPQTRALIDQFLIETQNARAALPATLAAATGELMDSLTPYFSLAGELA